MVFRTHTLLGFLLSQQLPFLSPLLAPLHLSGSVLVPLLSLATHAHTCGDLILSHVLKIIYLPRISQFIFLAQISSLILNLCIQVSWGEKNELGKYNLLYKSLQRAKYSGLHFPRMAVTISLMSSYHVSLTIFTCGVHVLSP